MGSKKLKILCFALTLILSLSLLLSCDIGIENGNSNDNDKKPNTSDGNKDNNNTPGNSGTTNDGNQSIDPVEVYDIGEFSNNLARIRTSTGFGYINPAGEIVLAPKYSAADELANELIFVTLDGKQHFIDTTGKIVFTATGNEEKIGPYSNGYFCVVTKREELSGTIYTLTYYDKNGKIAFEIDDSYYLDDYSDINEYGYAIVSEYGTNHLKIIDSNGNTCTFKNQATFILEKLYSKFLYNAVTCHYFIDYQNQKFEQISRSLAFVESDYYRTGFKIYKGLDLIADLSEVEAIQNASAYKLKVGTSGNNVYMTILMQNQNQKIFSAVVDQNGTVILSPTMDILLAKTEKVTVGYVSTYKYIPYKYKNGLCLAQNPTTKLFGYIDINGDFAIEASFESATDFYATGSDAIAVVNGNTVINKRGAVIFTTGDIETKLNSVK